MVGIEEKKDYDFEVDDDDENGDTIQMGKSPIQSRKLFEESEATEMLHKGKKPHQYIAQEFLLNNCKL